MVQFVIDGHPVPYLRMTQGQVKLCRIPDWKLSPSQLKKKGQLIRYFEWKEYVDLCAIKAKVEFDRAPKEKKFMDLVIFFKNKVHGDPDNIFKGIADALFSDDKYIAGSFDFFYDKENPRVEIKIY